MAELRVELRGDDEVWLDGSCDADAYARLCDPLVREGRVAHYVVVDAADADELDRWYGLCFGRQQVYGEAAVRACDFSSRAIRVREGTLADAVALGDLVVEANAAAPVWSGFAPRGAGELRRIWAETLSAPEFRYLVADLDGRPAGYVLLDRGEGALAVAATRPELRGRGVGLALFSAAMDWAAGEGLAVLRADWRSTNLLAARFWPARGFRPVRYRLHRYVAR